VKKTVEPLRTQKLRIPNLKMARGFDPPSFNF
jgi:hypothetical protein